MNVIDGTNEIVAEPDWTPFFSRATQKSAAAEYWRAVTTEMRGRNILSPGNAHAIARLVLIYIAYDEAAAAAARAGAVLKPKRGNPKAIARVNPQFTVMKETAAIAAAMEAELGLSPRRRAGAVQVERRTSRVTGSGRYLRNRAE